MTEFSVEVEDMYENKTYDLSLDDILNDEKGGVYIPEDWDRGVPPTNFIVVFPGSDNIFALFIGAHGEIEELAYDEHKKNSFRRYDYDVELKLVNKAICKF